MLQMYEITTHFDKPLVFSGKLNISFYFKNIPVTPICLFLILLFWV